MTPFVKILYELDQRNNWLNQHTCFDVTGIVELVSEVKHQLIKSSDDKTIENDDIFLVFGDKNPTINHGGLFFSPCERFALEFFNPIAKRKIAMIADQGIVEFKNKIDLKVIMEGQNYYFASKIEYDENNLKMFTYDQFLDKFSSGKERTEYFETCLDLTLEFISFLLIINAPYGIRKTIQPLHKGHERLAKKQGYRLLPNHIITIDKTKVSNEISGNTETGTPKAFHFVRSHRRCIDMTYCKYTIVKAHWRGDPSLGIHRTNNYKLKHYVN